jgi:surface polysaccharide O-acyltransferase-like enzyme
MSQGGNVLIDNNIKPKKSDEYRGVSYTRRYDVDWLRILAIGLLIVFHVMLSFQPWASAGGFPQNNQLLEGLWAFIALLTIWRIPILFMISGMGVRFAMEHRDWKLLIKDRTIRILIPYLFGILVLGTLFAFILPYLGWDEYYIINFGHLWFLLNIYLYTIWLIGILIYLKDNPDNAFLHFFSKLFQKPLGLFLISLPLMVETWLVNPKYFGVYIDSVHGWLVGLICFFIGFLFISIQKTFWPAVEKNRWMALGMAILLYCLRLFIWEPGNEIQWLIALESMSWMLAILGFGSLYLNKPTDILSYFSRAVYPIYIIHLPIQFTIAYFLLPLSLTPVVKLILMLLGTFGGSIILYHYVLRQLKWIRPLIGMKMNYK